MQLGKIDFAYFILIFIISCILVVDLFLNIGRPASFDGIVHVTNLAQFTKGLQSGDFPVTWLDGFANYGMPIPLIAHQVTNYLGAAINMVLNNAVLSFNIVSFIGVFLSGITYYLFLRLYFKPLFAFLATFLFTFAPYKILNLYIRADAPELFSMIFLPLILMGMYFWIKEMKISGLFLLAFAFCFLCLTHPLMLITYAFIYVPYFFFLLVTSLHPNIVSKQTVVKIVFFGIAVCLGVGMASYYILPLNLEIKYFTQGTFKSFLSQGNYLSLNNFIDPRWFYYTQTEVFPRGHVIQAGIFEVLGVLWGVLLIVKRGITGYYKKNEVGLLELFVAISFIVAFFTLSISNFFYVHISLLDRLLFPWRMFSAFIFLPPIILAYLLARTKYNSVIIILFVALVCFLRFPQLYGKNYTFYPEKSYYFTTENLYSNNLNTVWTGQTDTYPEHKIKGEIVEGEGNIILRNIKNSSREYTIDAKTNIRMVDYTFYFPGWHVYVDGKNVPIQFQNPLYRGVITYTVPAGKHQIFIKFEDTKVRLISKILSGIFFLILLILFLMRKKIAKRFKVNL